MIPLFYDYQSNEIKVNLHLHSIAGLFKKIYSYKVCLHQLLPFNSGVLATSGLYAYALYKTEDFNFIIKNNLPNIDEILSLLVSPNHQQFTRAYLIKNCDYPNVDLLALYID